jgi:hypothetical protein
MLLDKIILIILGKDYHESPCYAVFSTSAQNIFLSTLFLITLSLLLHIQNHRPYNASLRRVNHQKAEQESGVDRLTVCIHVEVQAIPTLSCLHP